MRTINFTSLTVLLGCIAMIGAIHIDNDAVVASGNNIARDEEYVPFTKAVTRGAWMFWLDW
jgi:hypothetical protein